ncbi:tripartite tricarboxylate transporter permease [Thermodesulfobacteriota bacterium]
MDVLDLIGVGFSVALEPTNLFFCFIGVFFGTLVGVIPGFGPVAALSLLLPFTFKLPAVTAIIMLAGIYYGAMYGGSTTSILVNIPGETASVITCLDGYQMALQGRAGPALGIVAFGSFIAGTAGVVGLMFLAPILAQAAVKFGPPEFFSLTFFGLIMVTYLARGSTIKALTMVILGLFAGCIGIDPMYGTLRFAYGSVILMDGVGIIPAAIGIFGIAEVLKNIESIVNVNPYDKKITGLLPNLKDWKDSFWPIARGTILGFFIGLLPGPATTISTFASYAVEKKFSRYPEKFGTGVIEGVAGPESANNAASTGNLIPLLSLGIPLNTTTAILLGGLMIHGIQPGPLFIAKYPELFWGVISSMYVGNAMLLVLNLPLISIWVRFLKIPYVILFPFILLFCIIGVYTLNNEVAEVFIMLIFGIIGFLMRKAGFEGAPFLLGMVLGPIMESSLRQSLVMSDGSFVIFFIRPLSAILVLLGLSFLTSLAFPIIIKSLTSYKKLGEGE